MKSNQSIPTVATYPRRIRLWLFGLLATGASVCAAQDLGQHKDWRAHVFTEQSQRVCSMWSQPKTALGKYTKRGEIFAFVTHRTNARNKVSFEMGYDFGPEAKLTVSIGEKSFELTTSGSTAWTSDATVGAQMAQAMRAGSDMVVVGVSKRGTKTTDTYSLSGFTAAHKAIDRACS